MKRLLPILLAVLFPAVAFSQQKLSAISQVTAVTNTDLAYAVTGTTTKASVSINWSNVLNSMKSFNNWPASSGGGGPFNTSQFESTTVTNIKSGAVLTNIDMYGDTEILGSSLAVGVTSPYFVNDVLFQGSISVDVLADVFSLLAASASITGTMSVTGEAAASTNFFVGGTNVANWVRLPKLTDGMILQLSGSTKSVESSPMKLAQSFPSLADGQVLKYHSGSATWTNGNDSTSGVSSNGNQFASVVPITIKNNPLITNATIHETIISSNLQLTLGTIGGGKLTRTDANTNISAVTIGTGLTWDGTTLSANAGTGEANVNGEAAVTNGTRFGWVYGKAGVTNLLRSFEPIELLSGINQGTNILLRINSQTLTNLAGTGAITNAPWTNSYQPGSTVLTNLAGTGAITNAPWTNSYQPGGTWLTNITGTGAITNAPWTNSYQPGGTWLTNITGTGAITNAPWTNSYQPGGTWLTNITGTGAITNAPWTNSYQPGSAWLTNIAGTGAITNAPWTNSYQPATGVLTNLQNLLILSNLNNALFAQQTALIPTNSSLSNVVVNLRTNVVDLYTTNNLTFTNYTGVQDGVSGSVMFRITPQLINRGVTYPVSGNSYNGTKFWTNQNSTLWTTLTQGVTYVYTLTFFGTNVHASLTAWQ